jgi:hypothetical protein
MKVSKMPGFGSFGVIVEDFEWDQPEAYDELRELSIKQLVVSIKGDGTDNFDLLAKNDKKLVTRQPSKIMLRYGRKTHEELRELMSPEEFEFYDANRRLYLGQQYPLWHRVTGKLSEDKKAMGLFGDTELLWHSNNFLSYDWSPLVMLYGKHGMVGSSTSFLQTVDWYEKQTESFKSELNELVSICDFHRVNMIVPNARDVDMTILRTTNNAALENFRKPLVIDSVVGYRGINFSYLIKGFEGMSQVDSDKIINKIKTELLDSTEYQYDSWWSNDTGDLLMFDNIVCLHMRKTSTDNLDEIRPFLQNRIGYRISGEYPGHEDWNGFILPEFREHRQKHVEIVQNHLARLDKPQ